jgi:triacylglycerol esterase/lipase EstA (alpha/beta hydrolase family)
MVCAPHTSSGRSPPIEPLEPRLLLALVADLVVAEVSGTQSSYSVGTHIKATTKIRNSGDLLSQTGLFSLKYYLGKADPNNSSNNNNTYRVIEQDSVANLVGGNAVSDSINFPGYKIPADVPGGTYYITVWVDSGKEVREKREDNNLGFSSRFEIKQADLVVSSVAGVNTSYNVGQLINAQATVENKGEGSTVGPFNTRFFLGTADGENKKLFTLDDQTILLLNAGKSITKGIDLPGWRIPRTVAEGNYRVWVYADWGADSPESDEANNWGSSPSFRINRPDLKVTSVILGGSEYNYGDVLQAAATITNDATASTLGPFKLNFYLGSADGSDREDELIKLGSVVNLNGGDSTSDQVNLPLPRNLPPGTYKVWVKVDPGGDIPESDEDNNWGSSTELHIQGARWEDTSGKNIPFSVSETRTVYLSLTANNVDHSTVFIADIYEDDVASNELMKESVELHWESGSTWRARWLAFRIKDVGTVYDPTSDDAEYFFRVRNPPPGLLFAASENLTVTPRAGTFGVELSHHSVGTGIPMVLVHGNNSDVPDKAYDLYRWRWFAQYIEEHPDEFAKFDVWLWKHDTSLPIGFNGEAGTQAAGLADFIYNTLGLGMKGRAYERAKVALLAHSQGGLVSRSFMNYFDLERGRLQGDDVSGLITLGTPHHGSPFAIRDWVAAVMANIAGSGKAGEEAFNVVLERVLEKDRGTLNLSWDNMDGVIEKSYVTSFPNSSYTLTQRDLNMRSALSDPAVLFTETMKSDFGTLRQLNEDELFYHKFVAIGAYDALLADNKSAAESWSAMECPTTKSSAPARQFWRK